MKKCIVIPDSFKGTLSSTEACRVISEVLASLAPTCTVMAVPIADGGEGTVDCFEQAMAESRRVNVRVSGPYGEPLDVHYIRQDDTAVMEMAKCAGLPLVDGRQNPLETTTYGVGEMIAHAVRSGCRRIILGLGGSCTNDAGTGMAAALGVVFKDENEHPFVPVGGTLSAIADYDAAAASLFLQDVEITAMCDIDSPMHGPKGAAYVFAPQKGASETDVIELDNGLKSIDKVIAGKTGASIADVPGAGAAGAMGAGVIAFLGGKLKPGIDTILDTVGFDAMLVGADLVITGEGRVDAQSAMGKVISGVALRAKRQNVPVVVVAGGIEAGAEALYDLGVVALFSIHRTCETLEVARTRGKENLRNATEGVIRLWLTAEKTR